MADDGSFATVIKRAMREGWGHAEGPGVRWTLRSLAERTRVHYATVFRWTKGESCPQYETLRLAVDAWGLPPDQRRQLFVARDRSDRKSPVAAVVPSSAGGDEVKRRDFLAASGALLATPTTGLAFVPDSASRYKTLGILAEGVTAIPRDERLAAARRLYGQCAGAAAVDGGRTDYLLAAMSGSLYSVMLVHDDPLRAIVVSRQARQAANAAGYNVARMWAATAEALCARKLDKPLGAIEAVESVINLPAERGTMPVFAASCLAESYSDIGDRANVVRCLELADRFRSADALGDEFGGKLTFPIEQEWDHGAYALLGIGQYADAISYAERSLATYEKMPKDQRRPGYMQSSCVAVASASVYLGSMDRTEEYMHRALAFTSSWKLEPVFKPLQQALAHADAPRLAAHVREAVALS
ncbi:MAG: helix-turn-helix transcriptional regulator [Myxococcota bacterium]